MDFCGRGQGIRQSMERRPDIQKGLHLKYSTAGGLISRRSEIQGESRNRDFHLHMTGSWRAIISNAAR